MKFHLRVYDNYHIADESEAYNHGEFETYEAATVKAREIVTEFFEHYWKPGMNADYLLANFTQYGETPVILPNEPGDQERFSALAYAQSIASIICEKLENK